MDIADQERTKEQLTNELGQLRRENADLRASEARNREIREAFGRSEKCLHSLCSCMSEGLCLHEVIYDESGKSLDYRILDVNPAYEYITGINKEEAIGNKASEIYGTGKPPYIDFYAEVAATGQPDSFETYFSPMEKYFRISVFSPNEGQFATVFTDITEYKQQEMELRKHRDHLEKLVAERTNELIVANSELKKEMSEREKAEAELNLTWFSIEQCSIPAFWINSEGKFLYVNQAVCNSLGYTRNELLSMSVSDMDPNFTVESWPEQWEDLKKLKIMEFESQHIRKDGTAFPVDIAANYLELDETEYNFAFARDISRRRQAEQELRNEEENLRSLINAITEAALLIENDGIILAINKIAADNLGEKPNKILGKNAYDFVSKEISASRREMVEKVVHTGQPVKFDDLEKGRHFHNSFYPILDDKGEVSRIAIFAHDYTEQEQIAQALAESEERYRNLFDNAPDAIFLADPSSGKILDANQAASELLLRPHDEIIGLHQSELHPPSVPDYSKEVFIEHVEFTQQNKQARPIENMVIRPDGTEIPVEVLAQMLHIGGKPVIQGVFRDISQRKKAAEALEESEERYRSIIQNSPMGMHMYQLEPDGRLVFIDANPAADEILGVKNSQFIGKTIEKAFPPLAETEVPEKYRLAASEGQHWSTEQINYEDERISGAFEVHAFQVAPGRMVTIFLDITERKQIEHMLETERKRLYSLLDGIPAAVYLQAPDYSIKFANKYFREQFGDPEGRRCHEVLERRESPCEICRAFNVFDTQEPISWEWSKTPNGRIYDVYDYPFSDVDGSPLILELSIDVTERRRVEEDLLKMQKLESVGVLAGGIAHDFNNILTGIVGNISLAKMHAQMGRPLARILERLDEAEKSSMRARDLTQQLLTFSSGGSPLKKIASISALLKESAALASSGSSTRCEFSISQDLWEVEIDEGQMNQVIRNMVINASQAMARGGVIKISAGNMILESGHGFPLRDGKYVKVSVEDHGTGIPPDNLPKIFDPYFTTKQEGSGLGLAICYSIVEKHDGYITAESQIGAGTTIYIYLPAHEQDAVSSNVILTAADGAISGRILVMDDEEIIRNLAADLISSFGYKVTVTVDGNEAIELYKEAMETNEPFDTVVLDLTIPGGMGGIETIKKLKEIDPEVKAIVSSGYSNNPAMANFSEHGFKGAINKPYRVAEMSEVLHKVVGKK